MSSVGIINNVQAGRTRARLAETKKLIARCDADTREVGDLPSIVAATHAMLDAGVDLIAINGGDGTAQAAVTEIFRRGTSPPQIAVLPGGTTNLTAHDLNGRLSLSAALDALAHHSRRAKHERPVTRRSLLAVQAGDAPREFGFFLGAGAILAGMQHFREHVGSRGFRDELAAGLSLLRGLAGIAGGEHAWSRHETAVTTPDHREFAGRQNLVLATTLERLLLGLRPWWGSEPGPVHLTALGHQPQSFLRVVLAILRGKAHARATPERGYCSANVDSFVLEAEEGFALDGQVFNPPTGAAVAVSATDALDFVCLGRQQP